VTAIQEVAIADAREALGESQYEAHLAVGRGLSPEDAVTRLQSGAAEPITSSKR
jgi:hypothetical protein